MDRTIQTIQIVLGRILVNYYAVPHDTRSAGAILFLHGWGADGAIWFPIMRELRDAGFALYSIDFPGFGKSEMPSHPFFVDDYMEVVDEFIQKLALKNCIVVAHSFGGRVAIKLAAAYPNLIQKLVLVDSAGVRLTSQKLTIKQNIIRTIKPLLHLWPLCFLRPYLYRLFASEDYLAYPRLRETFVKVVNEDLTPILPRVTTDTLLVWGAKDNETPLAAAKIMQKNILRSRLVILSNAGHFSFLDDQQGFLQILKEFL
ncbi:alpha/beta hydrolase [Patescibacteria group bacterium]|nr:alpha/beta hydrolase [Patescibacteria group bacterium]